MGLIFRETKKIFGHTQDLNTQKGLELSVVPKLNYCSWQFCTVNRRLIKRQLVIKKKNQILIQYVFILIHDGNILF